jgi:hypothetical protein
MRLPLANGCSHKVFICASADFSNVFVNTFAEAYVPVISVMILLLAPPFPIL